MALVDLILRPFLFVAETLVLTFGILNSFVSSLFSEERKKAKKKDFDNGNVPPLVPGHWKEVSRQFRNNETPQYLLNSVRSLAPNHEIVRFRPFPFVETHLVSDGAAARQILEDPIHSKFCLGYSFANRMAGGDTFFASESHRFKHVRKSTSVAFAPHHVKRMIHIARQFLEEWIQDKLKEQKQKSNKENEVDSFQVNISEEMQRLTIQVIAKAAFDYTLTKDEIEAILKGLKITQIEYSQTARNNPVRNFLPWFYKGAMEARRASKCIYSVCERILRERRAKLKTTATKSNNYSDTLLLDCIIQDEQYESDPERVRDMIVYFFAGFDTTGHTIAFCLLELARKPDTQTWLRNELQKSHNTKQQTSDDKDATPSSYSPALKATIRETMRLHPTAPIIALRVLEKDIVVTRHKYYLPQKTFVFMSSYVMGRDQAVFEDADSFIPQRWTANDDKQRQEMMKQFWVAFGVGRRACQGQPLANAELLAVLEKLVRCFQWEVVEEGRVEFYVTLKTMGTVLRATRVAE